MTAMDRRDCITTIGSMSLLSIAGCAQDGKGNDEKGNSSANEDGSDESEDDNEDEFTDFDHEVNLETLADSIKQEYGIEVEHNVLREGNEVAYIEYISRATDDFEGFISEQAKIASILHSIYENTEWPIDRMEALALDRQEEPYADWYCDMDWIEQVANDEMDSGELGEHIFGTVEYR